MFVVRPFDREYAIFQQGSYSSNHHMMGLHHATWNVNQFSRINAPDYQEVSANRVHQRKPALSCNTRLGSMGATLSTETRESFSYSHSTSRGCDMAKNVVPRDDHEAKKEICAFGPQHAEHARRLYQSEGAKSKFGGTSVSLCRYDNGPMNARYKQTQARGYPLREMKSRLTAKPEDSIDRLGGDASELYETVLRVANISPRPGQEGTREDKAFSFPRNELPKEDHQLTRGKTINFQDSECEKDLSNAPIFQILREISLM